MWAGVTAAGQVYKQLPVYKFLSSLKGKKVKILLGLPYQTCYCADCKKSYGKRLQQYRETMKHFPEFEWRFSPKSHMKMYLLGKRCFVGGLNLTDSNFADFMIETKPNEKLKQIFEKEFSKGRKDIK
jgi:hypothetical protein